MKILVTSFTFPPQASGVSEIARSQACGLSQLGHNVTVATDFDPNRENSHWPPGVVVRQFDVRGSDARRDGCQGETGAYERFIADYDGDIICCNCWQNWATDLALRSFPRTRARKAFVSQGFDAHMWLRQPRFAWGLGQWIRAQPYVWRLPRMLKSFDHVILLSKRCDFRRFIDHWLARRLVPNRVSVIPNGVHLQDLSNARKDFRKTYNVQSKYMLLNVANYCDRKNQLSTLRDFARANRSDTTLVFIGSEFNDYTAQMNRAWERLRVDFPSAKMIMLEKVSREMINAAYQTADLFILSAKHETQPLAILDAMASAVPFISTDVGCVTEFPGGLVVPAGPRTTSAIARLLEDPAHRARLGDEGSQACSASYSWDHVIGSYEALFKQMNPS